MHVLHLVPNWDEMLNELDRVVRPGGSIVMGLGSADGRADPIPREVIGALQRAAGMERPFPGLLDTEMPHLEDVTDSLGWSFRLLPEVQDVQERSIEELIGELEGGTPSWTWDMSEEERRDAAALTRERMKAAYGDIEAPRTFDSRIVFRAYRTWKSASRPM